MLVCQGVSTMVVFSSSAQNLLYCKRPKKEKNCSKRWKIFEPVVPVPATDSKHSQLGISESSTILQYVDIFLQFNMNIAVSGPFLKSD